MTTLFSGVSKQNLQTTLFCGVTKEELQGEGICIDLLIDGGTSDEKLNIYELKTWEYLLEKYNYVDIIFIDGGIYGSFQTFEVKEKVLNIIQRFCKKGLIIYGNHLLKRFNIPNVKSCTDLLQRSKNLPFTYIPIKEYTSTNFKIAYNNSAYLKKIQKVRVSTEYVCKF